VERASDEDVRHDISLFASVPLLRQALDAVPDIFMILNEERQIVFANAALMRLLGIPPESFSGGMRPGEVLNCAHAFLEPGGCGASEFCRTCGAVQAIISSLRGVDSINECRITQQNGNALDLQVWATPLDLDGRRFTLFTVKDISHEKRRRALERIFFHNLLNTAGGVMGFAELLMSASPEELNELKSHVYQLSLRLIEEINAQKELAAAENDELAVEPVTVDSLSMLSDVMDLYAFHELSHDRIMRITPHAQAVPLSTDPVLLRRVLGNMLKNALEAISPGETVTLNCYAVEDGVAFEVHNPGFMPRNVQLQVFQRSFSTKGSGRGLGTYSIKLLIQRYLRGKVSFHSTPSEGTTFRVVCPRAL
jgi:signal transduction histidine kinase